ncbi:MAG: PTS sugar transporter subunit IIA [Planctomycetota bacterium]|jgi:mannitol/fructose-specific phosphotransferase system IIA component (Ntr-type)
MPTDAQAAWKLFKPKACSNKLKGEAQETIFGELVDVVVKGGVLDKERADDARAALEAREKLASTGVGKGVAIPHVKLPGLDRAVCSLAIHPEGVEWNALDGEPVQIFFVVLRPDVETEEYDPERHLEMMRWIARLARNEDFRRFAIGSKNRTELVDLLKEMAQA